jgi:hypothetical protein
VEKLMSVSGIRDGLKTRLATISGLYIHDTAPGAVNQTPAAVILPMRGDYGRHFGSGATHYFRVGLLAAIGQGWEKAQDQLDDFLSDTGTKSIRAAIEADPGLGGAGEGATVLSYGSYDIHEYGGSEYMGVDIEVQVWEP